MLGYDLVFTFESKVAQDQQALTLQGAKLNTTQSFDHHKPSSSYESRINKTICLWSPISGFHTEWLLDSCSQSNMSPPATARHKLTSRGKCSLKCVNDDECWRFKMWHRKCDHTTLVTCSTVDTANQGGCLKIIWTHIPYFLLCHDLDLWHWTLFWEGKDCLLHAWD